MFARFKQKQTRYSESAEKITRLSLVIPLFIITFVFLIIYTIVLLKTGRWLEENMKKGQRAPVRAIELVDEMSNNHLWVPNDDDPAWRAPCSSTHSALVFKSWAIALIVISALQTLGPIVAILIGMGAFDTAEIKIDYKGVFIGIGIVLLVVEVGMIVSTCIALQGLARRSPSHFLPFLVFGMINWIFYCLAFFGSISTISGGGYSIATTIVIIIELVIMYFAYLTGYRTYCWLKHMEHYQAMPTQIVAETEPVLRGGHDGVGYSNPPHYQA